MYRIGLFSKLGKVTVKTLHHYDETGLLKPAYVDEENGYRYYTATQLLQLDKIVILRQMGFSIPEITDIIAERDVTAILDKRKKELISELEHSRNCLSRLENYITQQKEGELMKYQAVIKQIPACTVYAKSYTIPHYTALNGLMPTLAEQVAVQNPDVKCTEPNYCFNLYLDNEYRDTDIHVEICAAVTTCGRDSNGIVFKEVPAITAACILHRGSYENLRAAYAYAIHWVVQNGYSVTDPIRESYIDGSWSQDEVEGWLTEIQVPITKTTAG